MEPTLMFVGPSSYGIKDFARLTKDIVIYPPIKRRELIEIITTYSQVGTIIIVDGTFYDYPSVGHKEIKYALELGWRVFGLCSMGAIRASEMYTLGMIGYGYVYRYFRLNAEAKDDEVALLYAYTNAYLSITEPLINIKYGLRILLKRNILKSSSYIEITNILHKIWFGYRTLSLVKKLLLNYIDDVTLIEKWLDDFNEFRIKNIDLETFLKEQVWKKY